MSSNLPPRLQAAYSLRNFNILLVEDYDFIRNMIVSMLRAFGVGNVTTCSSAGEAIELIKVNMAQVRSGNARMFDIILTDWMMPKGGGEDLVNWIRNQKEDHLRFMPIIMISAFANEDAVTFARDHGVNEVLVKPVSAEKMASRILSIIDHPRPYIKASTFFGPDRRRRAENFSHPDRRKTRESDIREHYESST